MTGRFTATVVLLLAALAAVNAVIVAVGRRRRDLSYMQNLPTDCALMVDVAKRDGSNEIAFHVCVTSGDVCTSIYVPSCTASKTQCKGFQPDSVDTEFKNKYPDAYAKVCEEGGELCLYTDIVYHTCGAAKVQNEICLPLSNGELECAEIPEDDHPMIESLDNQAPQAYHQPAPKAYRRPATLYGRPAYWRIQA